MTAPVVLGTSQVRLDEVYLAGTTDRGPTVVGGLGLVADENGFSVLGPDPGSVRTMPWSRATTIGCRMPSRLPDGREAIVLEIAIDGGALRFLVPAADLGSPGAGAGAGAASLEEHLASLAGVEILPPPAVPAPPVAIGGTQNRSGISPGISPGIPPAPPGVVLPPAPPGVVLPGSAQGFAPPAVSDPGEAPQATGTGVFAPAAGGTLSGMSDGQYVQVGKQSLFKGRSGGSGGARRGRGGRRSKGRVVAGVLVLVIAAGAAGAYVVKARNGSSLTSASKDSQAAEAVNISPGDLPEWKGVPGTIGGVLGSAGYVTSPGTSVSAGAASSVALTAAAAFDGCTKGPVGESNAALSVLGFSQGLSAVPGMTALSASPVFEDPAIPGTSAESSAMEFSTAAEQTAAMSVFSQPVFAGCFQHYLEAVVPALVGGSLSGSAFGSAWVQPTRLPAPTASVGVVVQGFGLLLIEAGHPSRGLLYEDIDVVGGGRMIAVTQTISPHPFPVAVGGRLLTEMEQNVAGQS